MPFRRRCETCSPNGQDDRFEISATKRRGVRAKAHGIIISAPYASVETGKAVCYRTLMTVLLAVALIAPSVSEAYETPTKACFEIFADSEGEMARATDPAWRKKARPEIEKRRAESERRRSRIDGELAKRARDRDRLQRDYDRGAIHDDDFKSARFELETDVRTLVAERDAKQIPACDF